ncbi:hypothetical protein AVEN_139431-1, partial [Araneus ventricosus]
IVIDYLNCFYQNADFPSTALRKFQTLKGLRTDPITVKGLQKLIMKFEEAGSLSIEPGKARNLVSAEEVVVDVWEDSASNFQTNTSFRNKFP